MRIALNDLTIGDVVTLGTTQDVSYFVIYLGNTTIKQFVFYTLDAIYKSVLRDKDLKEQRLKVLDETIENNISKAVQTANICYVARQGDFELIKHIDTESIKLWYAKSRMLNKELPILSALADLQEKHSRELRNLVPYSGIEEKVGMVFVTQSKNVYYVALQDDYYVKVLSKYYKDFCNGKMKIYDMGNMYKNYGINQIKTKTNWYFTGEILNRKVINSYLHELYYYNKWGDWD